MDHIQARDAIAAASSERTGCPMRRTGQTREVRLWRLSEGRCPVHGQPMTLLGEANGLRVVHCPRVRCDVRGVQMPTGSRAVRLPKAHKHLLSVAQQNYPGIAI